MHLVKGFEILWENLGRSRCLTAKGFIIEKINHEWKWGSGLKLSAYMLGGFFFSLSNFGFKIIVKYSQVKVTFLKLLELSQNCNISCSEYQETLMNN